MQIDKFTNAFQQALQNAHALAVERHHQFIEPIHLLSVQVQPQGALVPLLQLAGADIAKLRQSTEDTLARLAQVEGVQDVHLSQATARLLMQMEKLAKQHGDVYVASELFIEASLDSQDASRELLTQAGLTKQQYQQA